MDPIYYKVMQQKTNKELVRLVYFDRNNFHHEGVSVAEEEIKRREISESEIQSHKLEIEKDIQAEKLVAEEPLEFSVKIGALLMPGVVPFMLSKKFEDGGLITKAKQLRQWSVYGFVMYSVLVVALLLLML